MLERNLNKKFKKLARTTKTTFKSYIHSNQRLYILHTVVVQKWNIVFHVKLAGKKFQITWSFYMQIVMGLALTHRLRAWRSLPCLNSESSKHEKVLKQKTPHILNPHTFSIFCILACPAALIRAWLDMEIHKSPCFWCHAGKKFCTLHTANQHWNL